jgi:hypothetical protein
VDGRVMEELLQRFLELIELENERLEAISNEEIANVDEDDEE